MSVDDVYTHSFIHFLSDYGLEDESVGTMRAVMQRLVPGVTILDITHSVPKFDIRAGSMTLARALEYLPQGVIVAVVDPGTGSPRRPIAVEVGDGRTVFVGPDNGLLAPAVTMAGGPSRVVELTNSKYHRLVKWGESVGRDIYAPAAAHLCDGVEFEELGPLVDPSLLTPALLTFAAVKEGTLFCDVEHVDSFGNVHLNATPQMLEAMGEHLLVHATGKEFAVRRATHYAEGRPAETLMIANTVGTLMLACREASAAQRHALVAGVSLTVAPG